MAYGRGHCRGTKRERIRRARTGARETQTAVELEQLVQKLAKEMLQSWQVVK